MEQLKLFEIEANPYYSFAIAGITTVEFAYNLNNMFVYQWFYNNQLKLFE